MKSLFQRTKSFQLYPQDCIDFMLLHNEYKTLMFCFVDLATGKGVEQGIRWLERVVSVLQLTHVVMVITTC